MFRDLKVLSESFENEILAFLNLRDSCLLNNGLELKLEWELTRRFRHFLFSLNLLDLRQAAMLPRSWLFRINLELLERPLVRMQHQLLRLRVEVEPRLKQVLRLPIKDVKKLPMKHQDLYPRSGQVASSH